MKRSAGVRTCPHGQHPELQLHLRRKRILRSHHLGRRAHPVQQPALPTGQRLPTAGNYDAIVQVFATESPPAPGRPWCPSPCSPPRWPTSPCRRTRAAMRPPSSPWTPPPMPPTTAGPWLVKASSAPMPWSTPSPSLGRATSPLTSPSPPPTGAPIRKAGPWPWRACPMPISPWQTPASGCPRSWTDRVPPPTPPLGATSSHGVGPSMTGPCSPVPTRR